MASFSLLSPFWDITSHSSLSTPSFPNYSATHNTLSFVPDKDKWPVVTFQFLYSWNKILKQYLLLGSYISSWTLLGLLLSFCRTSYSPTAWPLSKFLLWAFLHMPLIQWWLLVLYYKVFYCNKGQLFRG